LSKVETVPIREAIVGHLQHVDNALAQRVADGLALEGLPPAPPAAVKPIDMGLSPALQIIGKMKPTIEGRLVGILIDEGSNGKAVRSLQRAVEGAGARVKIIAPKVGGATLSTGRLQPADGQLAGTPSLFFDAVAVLLTTDRAQALSHDGAAVDFVRNAFGHLKAIAVDEGGEALLAAAGIEPDEGVIDARNADAFVTGAMGRYWDREPKVRMLA